MNNQTKPLFLALTALAATAVSAHAGFVLFGEAGPGPSPEQLFVRPVSAPYFHEDAFVTTDVRAWYLNHKFSADTIGGDAQVYALQVRVALTDRLQFVAYKDGYTEVNNSALGSPDGWNDIGAGLKYALVQSWEHQFHLAVGVGYELALGDDDVLQDTEELRLWVSANKGFGRLHLGAVANYLIAEDNNKGALGNADMITVHLHADYRVTDWFSPILEINGYFVTKESERDIDLAFSGVDAVSISAGENESTITGALGAEIRPAGDNFGLRGAYETQLGNRISLFGHRWTLSAVYTF